MKTDEVHSKILKYLSNEIFIKTISKSFEKRIEYRMILYILKTLTAISQHKNV